MIPQYLSLSRLSGNFDPGGNSGFSSGLDGSAGGFWLDDFEELPAFPDLTIPFLGGIPNFRSGRGKEKYCRRVTVTQLRWYM